jgi:hypothetical protein
MNPSFVTHLRLIVKKSRPPCICRDGGIVYLQETIFFLKKTGGTGRTRNNVLIIVRFTGSLVGYLEIFLCVRPQVRLLTCGSVSQYIEMLRRSAWHADA